MDYFNEGESELQAGFSARRDKLFAPIIHLLKRIGVPPNIVSAVGVLLSISAVCLAPNYWPISAILLLLYVFMDGLDGPLARSTGKASPGGSLVDIFCDQVGVMIVAVGAVYWLDANVAISIGVAFVYIHVIYMMVFVNQLKLKLPVILRVKYPYFLVYVVSLGLNTPTYLNVLCGLFLFYYLYNFFKLASILYKGLNDDTALSEELE